LLLLRQAVKHEFRRPALRDGRKHQRQRLTWFSCRDPKLAPWPSRRPIVRRHFNDRKCAIRTTLPCITNTTASRLFNWPLPKSA
jgi:hypothetical protein